MTVRPLVVVHVAVSLDGATTGFVPDVGTFYALAGTWRENATLTGADTVLAQEPALTSAPQPGPAPGGPLLAVVDSRARVRAWGALRAAGHWSDVLAVGCDRTPPRADRSVRELRIGRDSVDLAALLAELGGQGLATVRVDSGGALTGALLAGGLVDEVSLLVHPLLAGPAAASRRWYGDRPPPAESLALEECRRLDGDLVWLRHRVRR